MFLFSTQWKAHWCQRFKFMHSESNGSKPQINKSNKVATQTLGNYHILKKRAVVWAAKRGDGSCAIVSLKHVRSRNLNQERWSETLGHMLRGAKCSKDIKHAGANKETTKTFGQKGFPHSTPGSYFNLQRYFNMNICVRVVNIFFSPIF